MQPQSHQHVPGRRLRCSAMWPHTDQNQTFVDIPLSCLCCVLSISTLCTSLRHVEFLRLTSFALHGIWLGRQCSSATNPALFERVRTHAPSIKRGGNHSRLVPVVLLSASRAGGCGCDRGCDCSGCDWAACSRWKRSHQEEEGHTEGLVTEHERMIAEIAPNTYISFEFRLQLNKPSKPPTLVHNLTRTPTQALPNRIRTQARLSHCWMLQT